MTSIDSNERRLIRSPPGAVFLDRDGVLNLDTGYLSDPAEIVWAPGAASGVRAINAAGRLAIVVTNQSGVARGRFTLAQVEALHAWMGAELAAQGARIDAWRVCPHHPDFTGACDCRKPAPGLILRAIAEFGIDPLRSFLVGDRTSDTAAAAGARILGLLHDGGDLAARVAEGIARTGG